MKYSVLDGFVQSDSLVGIIIGPLLLFSIYFFFIGGFVFYLPALLWYHLVGAASLTLTGKGNKNSPPRFVPTILKGYLIVLTLGIIGPIGKKFLGLGGRFGGGGASGRW